MKKIDKNLELELIEEIKDCLKKIFPKVVFTTNFNSFDKKRLAEMFLKLHQILLLELDFLEKLNG